MVDPLIDPSWEEPIELFTTGVTKAVVRVILSVV